MMFMNLSDIAILNINISDYWCIINRITKNEAINLYKMSIWLKKWNIVKHKTLLWHIKTGKENLNLVILKLKKVNFAAMKFQFPE